MNLTTTIQRSTSTLVLFTASLVFAIGATPATGQVPSDSQKTGKVTGAAVNLVTPSTSEAGAASGTAASDEPSAEDAAKLQAARIRYGRLAQNFPGQITQFQSRAKELDRLLRQALPEPPAPPRTTITVIPVTPVKAAPAPVTAATTEPATVDVKVDDLKDLVRRLELEATSIRKLVGKSDDGLTVALRRATAAWVGSLDTLLRQSENKIASTAQR